LNLPRFSLKYPHGVLALVLGVVVMGTLSYFSLPTDLFPETMPPQVAVITVHPGASAQDVADKVTRNIERELNGLPGLKRITSVSRDEVSSVTVEFLFSKSLGEAVTDVQNGVARVRAGLPADVREPLLYRISDATRPLMTLAMRPGPDSLKSLADVRLMAENDIRDALIGVPGVGDVEVFGGHRPEIEVCVDRDALAGFGMTIFDVISGLARRNVAAPGGIIQGDGREYLLEVSGELSGLRAFEEMPVGAGSNGQILLKDVAEVRAGEADPRSRYHGNGREGVAVNVLRPEGGHTVAAISELKKMLPSLEAGYPDIVFEVTDDQQPLIDLNIQGMRSSLLQAVLLTILLIFLFLADLRAAVVVSVAIPLSFLVALVVLRLSPYTLNMVTLSGLIVAVGMVVDGAVVVLENIHRHHRESVDGDSRRAALVGASQVALPITAGMLTTVAVLVPVIFTTGYTGRIMRPLNIVIVATLTASLLVSLTVIPILAARLFRKPAPRQRLTRLIALPVEKGVAVLSDFYVRLVAVALRFRGVTCVLLLVFLVFSLRVVKPLLGGEQMPPMDTGIVSIAFDTDSSADPGEVNTVLFEVEKILRAHPAVLTVSSVVGSEPGAISFGGGSTSQSAGITVRLTPRTERTETIWDIEAGWREALRTVPGVRTFQVSEYGATPVSTTKAPFNVVISGPDPKVLSSLADKVLTRLRDTPGLLDLRRSWYLDKMEKKITPNPRLAAFYGTSAAETALSVRTAVQGSVATSLRLDGFYDIPVRVRYRAEQVDDPARLDEVSIATPSGPVRLGSLAEVSSVRTQPFITREDQRLTIDITAGNNGLTIAQVGAAAGKRLADLTLPKGYALEIAGTARDMAESQADLGRALVVGLALLFCLLMAMFKSLVHPVTIILSIPLAAAGGIWGLLLFDKPVCMPALMGIILLGGTVVNNAILMLDFIIRAREEGLSKDEAILQSVRLRLRPILITAVSTIVGFSPLIFETAVGLERMSPLGIVAASGLLVGTIVTMVAVPVIYSLFDSLQGYFARVRGKQAVAGAVLLFGLLGLAPGSVRAEPDALTLSEAVRIALDHNPDLELVRAELAGLRGRVLEAGAPKGVRLGLTGQGTWSEKKHAQVAGLSSLEQGFARTRYQVGLTASWLVMDFGATEARLRAALNGARAGKFLEQRKQRELVFAVSRQFLEAGTLFDLVEAAAGSRDSLLAFSDAVRKQIDQGKAPLVDGLKVDVRLAEVESRLAELNGELEIARAALGMLLGLDGELPPLGYADTSAVREEEWSGGMQPVGKKARADIRARELEVQAARERVTARERDFLPRVEVFAEAGVYGASDPETGTGLADDDPWKNDCSVGIKVTLPLLDGGMRRGASTVARAELGKARAVLRAGKLAVRHEVVRARAAVRAARAKLRASRKSVVHAQKVLRIEELKYRLGRGTSTEVLDAQAALLDAETLSRQGGRELEVALLAERLALGMPD